MSFTTFSRSTGWRLSQPKVQVAGSDPAGVSRAFGPSTSKGAFPETSPSNCAPSWSKVGKTPLIVRSSSLLEDNFGTSFAGKYESHFCPNQGTLEENLRDSDPGDSPHLCQRLQPGCAALSPPHGAARLRRAHGDLAARGAGPDVPAITFSRPWPAWPLAARPLCGIRACAAKTVLCAWCWAWARAPSIGSPTTIRA